MKMIVPNDGSLRPSRGALGVVPVTGRPAAGYREPSWKAALPCTEPDGRAIPESVFGVAAFERTLGSPTRPGKRARFRRRPRFSLMRLATVRHFPGA